MATYLLRVIVPTSLRFDAKRKGTGRKPNCTGKNTAPCGMVCRQPKNCNLSKREAGYIRKQGGTEDDIRRATEAKRKGIGVSAISSELSKRRAKERTEEIKGKARRTHMSRNTARKQQPLNNAKLEKTQKYIKRYLEAVEEGDLDDIEDYKKDLENLKTQLEREIDPAFRKKQVKVGFVLSRDDVTNDLRAIEDILEDK